MMEVDHYQLTWGCHLEAGADRTESRLTALCSLQDGDRVIIRNIWTYWAVAGDQQMAS